MVYDAPNRRQTEQHEAAMRFLHLIVLLTALLGVTGCASKFRTYNGPEVTSIVVHKAERRMYLLHDSEVLKAFDIELGFTSDGPKQFEGDGRTPEGAYYIDRLNPNSSYHLSLGISYPNQADREFARAAGRQPGGDIFIHGTPKVVRRSPDWTAGCIAVSDREIEVIYSMVKVGTPIFIRP